MKTIMQIICFLTAISLAFCSVSYPVTITEHWPGNAKGHITIRPSISIDGWKAHVRFDEPVGRLEVFRAKTTNISDQEFLFENFAWDGKVNKGDSLEIEFIARGIHSDAPTGRYYLDLKPSNGAFPPTTTSTSTDMPTTLKTTTTEELPTTTTAQKTTTTSELPTTITTAQKTSTAELPTSTQAQNTTTTTEVPTTATTQTSTSFSTTIHYSATHPTVSKQPIVSTSNVLNTFSCNHLSTVIALAQHSHLTNGDANKCVEGSLGSNEDLVLSLCDVDQPSTWRRGSQVMNACDQIPEYTPIATFSLAPDGKYFPYGAESGIFAGCLDNGFMMIVQHCNGSVVIEHVKGGLFLRDPYNYYVIN